MAGQGNAAKTLAVGLRAISISTEYTVEPTIKLGDDKSATPIYLLYCVDTVSSLYPRHFMHTAVDVLVNRVENN